MKEALSDLPSRIAEMDRKLVGFVYCRKFAPDILEIDNLFVHELYRNLGIGSTLLNEIEKSATKNFKGLILVNSDLYNNPVVNKQDHSSFYLRHGFALTMRTAGTRVFTKQLS